MAAGEWLPFPPPSQFLFLELCIDVVDCIAYSFDLFCRIIRNFNFKFFFKCHDQFNNIQRICPEIVNERGVDLYVSFVDAQLIDDDFLDSVESAHPYFTTFPWTINTY